MFLEIAIVGPNKWHLILQLPRVGKMRFIWSRSTTVEQVITAIGRELEREATIRITDDGEFISSANQSKDIMNCTEFYYSVVLFFVSASKTSLFLFQPLHTVYCHLPCLQTT